jgi:hypothetical protein
LPADNRSPSGPDPPGVSRCGAAVGRAGDCRLAGPEREASLGILDPHPAVDNANFRDLARGIDEDEKFRPLDASGYERRLDIKGPVARAEQLDDPAGQVE